MGLLSKLLGGMAPVDVMRADLFMEYHPQNTHTRTSTGKAAVQWVSLGSHDPNVRPFLVALLYARILAAHAETRTKLFELIDVISKRNVSDEGRTGFSFPEWMLHVGFGVPDQKIWPWVLVDSHRALSEPKLYNATLLAFPKSRYFGINLKMAFGQERIFAPASALIAITSYAESTDQKGRYELAVLLWQVNEFYGSPDRVRIGSESKALAAATTAIRTHDLRTPKNKRVATDSAFLSVGFSHANVPNSQRLPSPEITLFAKKNPRTGKHCPWLPTHSHSHHTPPHSGCQVPFLLPGV